MATATVIVFWIAVEAFNRTRIFSDMLLSPKDFPWHWGVMGVEFFILITYMLHEHNMKKVISGQNG